MIIDGKKIAEIIKDEIRDKVARLEKKPKLAVVLVGGDPASQVYVSGKKRACEYTGILSESHELPENTSTEELLALIDRLNGDEGVTGILVQLPLPAHISTETVLYRISRDKDVDCFHPYNAGLLSIGKPRFSPCTPAGVIELLKRYNIPIEGKNCVVIGRSNIVGKPMGTLLLAQNGTVTTAHSRTRDLAEISARADILVATIGKPKFVTAEFVKEGAVVIDVGIHRLDGKKLCGDVDFDAVAEKTAYITPVPGGVGPMTIAMLMQNCLNGVIL
ncbi:bifunctional protein FolD [Clostridia bacterium]|nr:bifunctional protein FolD [Clostridia bacterium]